MSQIRRWEDQLKDLAAPESRIIVSFTVEGVPVAKGRARGRIATRRDGTQFISFYTPKETELYEQAVAWAAKAAIQGEPPWECSCEASIKAFIPVPESWTLKKKGLCLAGELKPPSAPDVDNYAKAALDGCNGIIYHDDSLLWRIVAEKHYSENPRLEIEVRKFVPATLL